MLSSKHEVADEDCQQCPEQSLRGLNIVSCKILRRFQLWLLGLDICQGSSYCEISENTYIKIKDRIASAINEQRILIGKIGGMDLRLQVDETANCDDRIISKVGIAFDFKDGIQWIVGGVLGDDDAFFIYGHCPTENESTNRSMFLKFL